MEDAVRKLEQRIISLEAGARVQAATIRRLSDQVGVLLMERALPAAVAADPVRAEAEALSERVTSDREREAAGLSDKPTFFTITDERAGPPTPRDADEPSASIKTAFWTPGRVRDRPLKIDPKYLGSADDEDDTALAGEVTGDVGKPALPGGSVRELAGEVERLRTENTHLRRAISDAEAHIKRMGARA
jgi:uncharacterized coiled-coil protein SlyX